MAQVADELITRYTADDRASAKIKKIAAENEKLADATDKAKGKGGSKGGGMSGLMGAFTSLKGGVNAATAAIGVVVGALAAATAGLAGVITLGNQAVEVFGKYDTIERTFAGIYGSTAKATQMMKFLNAEADKSTFMFEDLAQNAKLLALQGLKWTDYSDAIQGLAVRGGGTSEALQMATSTVTRIKGGDYGEGFENLRQFGYNREVLTQMGLVFDKAGSYKGNVEQALAVIKKIGVENKSIVEAMNGGAEATMGNLMARIELAMAEIGKGIFEAVAPAVNSITSALSKAIDSGAFKDMADSVMAMFDIDTSESGLAKLIASVMAGVETAAAYVKMIYTVIKGIIEHPITQALLKFLNVGFGITPSGYFANGMKQDLAEVYDSSYKRHMMRMEAFDKKKAKSGPLVEPESEKQKESAAKAAAAMANPIAEIDKDKKKPKAETHTERSTTDMGRHVLGGGDIGRVGLTALELDSLSGRRRESPSKNTVKVAVYGSSFDQLFEDALSRVLMQMKRQGAF